MYKRIALASVFAIVVFTVCYLAQKSLETFENATVAQTQKHLLAIAKSKAQYIEGIFRDVHLQLISLASNPVVKKQIKGNIAQETIPDGAYCPIKLARRHLDNAVGSFYRIDSKGVVQARFPNKLHAIGKDFSSKPGVKFLLQHHHARAREEQAPVTYVSQMFSADSGRKAVSVCAAVIDNHTFIGLIRALVYLDAINDFLGSTNRHNHAATWMVGKDGRFIAHPEQAMLGVDLVRTKKDTIPEHDWTDLKKIIAGMTENQHGVGVFHDAWWDDGELQVVKRIAAFSPVKIENRAWSLAVTVSYDDVAGPIAMHKKRIVTIATLTVLALVAMAGMLLRIEKRKARLTIEAQAANRLKVINQKLKRVIVERRRVEKALGASEKHLKGIVHSIGVGVVLVDSKTHVITEVNPVAARLIGASRADIVGQVCHTFICPAEKGKCPVEDLGTRVEGSERVLLTTKGEKIPILKTVSQIEEEGGVLVETFTDIRHLKETQGKLQESEKTLQRTFDQAPIGAALLSLNNKILRTNESLSLITGYSAEELVTLSLSDLVHPQDRENAAKAWEPIFTGQTEQCTVETRCVRRNESVIWLRMSFGLIRDDSGNPSYILPMMEDITAQKTAMVELENREELFRKLTNLMPSGIVIMNTHGYCQYVNRGWQKRTGLSLQDSEGDGWIKGIHPEDQESVAAKFSGEYDPPGGVTTSRCRIMNDRGEFSEMEFRTIAIEDSHGGLKGYMATIS